jgi:hypothetical protein
MAMTLQDLVSRNVAGRDVFNPLFGVLGVKDWQQAPGGMDASGNPILWDRPNDAAMAAAQGFGFDWQNTGTGNTGTLTAFNPAGAQVGQFQQTDTNFGQDLLQFGALAAAGFGGAGLLGLGPAAGLFGGAGGAAAAAPSLGGAPLTAAQVAGAAIPAGGLPGLGAVGAGMAGAGGLAGAAGAAGGLGGAGAAASGGFWASALKTAAPLVGSVLGAGIQANAASKASAAQQAAAREAMKLLEPYMTAGTAGLAGQQALLGLSGPEAQRQAIQGIQDSPQFAAMQQLGENRILANASATGGLRGGNVQGALAQFSPQLLAQLVDQQYSRLGGLTQGGLIAANGSGQQAGQIGAAQAGATLAGGQALGQVLNSGANLLGQYLGGQTQAPTMGGSAPPAQTPFGNFSLGPF